MYINLGRTALFGAAKMVSSPKFTFLHAILSSDFASSLLVCEEKYFWVQFVIKKESDSDCTKQFWDLITTEAYNIREFM